MTSREHLDQIAWSTIKNRPPLHREAGQVPRFHRPLNYAEIGERIAGGSDFEHVWSDFLHGFFLYRTADYFTFPPPQNISREWQVVLAGAAEWLSAEFGLPKPVWVDEPQYFLASPWDPREDYGLDMSPYYEEVLRRSPEAFRKRNIAFESRNLIAL